MSGPGRMGRSLTRIAALLKKELRQVFRDPRLARVIFLAPTIQLIVFGYAVSTDVRNTATFVVDHDRGHLSRELIATFTASGYFRVVGASSREEDLVTALDRGEALVGLVIPPDFEACLDEREPTEVQLLFDGTSSNQALVARGYGERIIASFGLGMIPAGTLRLGPRIDLAERAWFNPDLVSRNYNVPAVAGAIVMLICLLLTSLAVVREREIGTLEQLLVSPLRPWELIAGKLLPFAGIGLFDLTLIITVALLWFEVPFRGSFLLLFGASLLFLLSGLGLGLLISTMASTQQEAFMTTFLIFMPTILLSGFLFPVASMPPLFQHLTLANPLRHFLEVVRAVFLKGAGVGVLWRQLLWLGGIGAALLTLAVQRFRRQAPG